MMEGGIRQVLGKRIRSVIVSRRRTEPRVQLFLVFDDDTHYEFYGDLTGAGHVREGGEDEVALYIESFEGQAVFYGDSTRSAKGLATRGRQIPRETM